MKGREERMTLREKKEIELEQSNFWGRHHGPAHMALSLSLPVTATGGGDEWTSHL